MGSGNRRLALRHFDRRVDESLVLLRARLRELAGVYPRWGVPRLHWRLRRDGELVNYKRVERLYRETMGRGLVLKVGGVWCHLFRAQTASHTRVNVTRPFETVSSHSGVS